MEDENPYAWLLTGSVGEVVREFKDKAKAEGKAEDVLWVADKRGIALTTQQGERILNCTDLETVNRWFDASIDATSAEEIFD